MERERRGRAARTEQEEKRAGTRKTLLIIFGSFAVVLAVGAVVFVLWAVFRDPLKARVGEMYHVEAGPSKFSLICRDEDTVDSINAAIARYDVAGTAKAHAERGRVGLIEEDARVEVVSLKGKFARVEVITGEFKGEYAWVDQSWLRHWLERPIK